MKTLLITLFSLLAISGFGQAILRNGATTNNNIGFFVSPNPNTQPGPYSANLAAQNGDNAHINLNESSGQQFYDSAGTLQMTVNPSGVFGPNIMASTAATASLATNANTANNSIQSPYFKKWSYLTLANQLGFNTNHLMDGLWPSSGQVTIGGTNLSCSAGIFQPYMTNWWVMVAHAGGQDNVTVNTNYPFGSNTKTFNNWYDAIGMITNVINSQNVILNSTFGITTNTVFIVAPTNNAPFQACYTFVCTNYGNNELDLPEGVIAFAGPYLSTGAWTNNLTCLISTPHIASSGPEKWVRLIGAVGPSLEINSSQGSMSEPNGILGTLLVPMIYGSNANLYSFIDTRDMTGPAIASDNSVILPVPLAVTTGTPFPAASMPYSDATFDFENLNGLCPYDCNFVMFNMLGALKKVIKNCDIQSSLVRSPSDAIGGTNGFGILNPGAFNDNRQFIDDVTVCQFYNGMSVGGNNMCYSVSIFSAWNAIVTESSANADTFFGLNVQADKNYIQTWGQGVLKIYGMWPQDTGPIWDSWPNLSIANNANFLFGSCDYVSESLLSYISPLSTSPSLGTGSLSYFTVNGNNGPQGGTPTASFTANEPTFLSPMTISNTLNISSTVSDLNLFNPAGSQQVYIQGGGYGSGANAAVRIYFGGGNGTSIGANYDMEVQSLENGGLPMFAAWPDGSFHTWSNIVCGANSIVYGSGSGLTNMSSSSFTTAPILGAIATNTTGKVEELTIPVVVTQPAATLGSSEIDAQIHAPGGAFFTVSDLNVAGGITSVLFTNKDTFVLNIPPGYGYCVTSTVSGTGYTAAIDNTGVRTNTLTLHP